MSTPFSNSTSARFGVPNTGSVRIDALLTDSAYFDRAFTYSFPTATSTWDSFYSQGENTNPSYRGLGASAQADVRAAFAKVAQVANVTFAEVADTSTQVGDFRFGFSRLNPDGAFMYAYLPFNGPEASDVWINTLYDSDFDFGVRGSFTFMALMHEILHGLGVNHPFDGPTTLPDALDTRKNTIMSYDSLAGNASSSESNGFYNTSLMGYDIAVLQYLYGANTTHASGNDTYTFRADQRYFETLYDTGGTDTLVYDDAGSSNGATIDLLGGSWSRLGLPQQYFGSSSGFVLDPETVFIWDQTLIENATGGRGNDTLFGNALANLFDGGGGSNTLDGRGGSDTARYVSLRSVDIRAEQAGSDVRLIHSSGIDTLRDIEFLSFSDGIFTVAQAIEGFGRLQLTSATATGPTNVASLVLDITGPSGIEVVILRSGAVFAVATETSAGVYRWVGNGLAEGSYEFRAARRDGGSISQQTDPLVYTIDRTAPTVGAVAFSSDTGVSATDGITRDAVQTITLQGEAGNAATLLVDGVAVGGASEVSAGQYRVSNLNLSNGEHQLVWQLTDAAGNSTQSAPQRLVVDAVAPVAGTLNGAPGAFARTAQLDLALLSEAGLRVTAQLDGAAAVALTEAPGGSYRFNVAGLAEGAHSLVLALEDTAGNRTQLAPIAWVVDTIAPTVGAVAFSSDTGVSATDGITRDAVQTITLQGEAGNAATLLVDGVAVGGASEVSAGQYRASNLALADGEHHLVWQLTDAAGNSTQSAPLRLVVDTAAPQAQSLQTSVDTGPDSGDHVTRGPVQTLSLTAEPGLAASLTLGGSALAVREAAPGLYQADTPALADGAYAVRWQLQDTAGNSSVAEYTLTVDNLAPLVTPLGIGSDTGRSATDGITASTVQTLELISEPGLSVALAIDGQAALPAREVSPGLYRITTPALADGPHSLQWQAQDRAGNAATVAPLQLVVDTAAPLAGTLVGTPPAFSRTALLNLALAAEPGLTVTSQLDGGIALTLPEASAGNYRLDLAGLAEGRHDLLLALEDAAGNQTALAPISWTVDTIAPLAGAIVYGPDTGISASDGITSERVISVSIRSEPGLAAVLRTSRGERLLASEDPAEAGLYRVDTAPLPDGRTDLVWELTDRAGNQTLSATTTITVDPNMPRVSTVLARGDAMSLFGFGDRVAFDAPDLALGAVLTPAFVPLRIGTREWVVPKKTVVVGVDDTTGQALILQAGTGTKARYSSWQVDSNGVLVGNKAVQLNMTALLARESAIGRDLNGDGSTGDVAVLVGRTAETASHTAWQAMSGGWLVSEGLVQTGDIPDAATPLLRGSKGWSPGKSAVVGATQRDDGLLELMLQSGSATKPSYSAQGFDADTGALTGKAVKFTAATVTLREADYGVDLNGDGVVAGLVGIAQSA